MILLLLLLLTRIFSPAPQVKIALTFDDFPMGSTPFFNKKERVEHLLQKLDKLKVKTVFFCIGSQIESGEGWACLDLISEEHLLANHSYNHLHFSEISLEDFKNELEKTEALLNNKINYRKWFRFPYIDYGDREKTGGTSHKRIRAFNYLRQRGYAHAYITINVWDWYLNSKMEEAIKLKKKINFNKLKEVYLELLDGWLDSYHANWSRSFRKPFVHILLLHENDINTLFLEDIVALIKKKKWQIVDPDAAFKSPIPYLARFPNSKGRLFLKTCPTLNSETIDGILEKRGVFSGQNP